MRNTPPAASEATPGQRASTLIAPLRKLSESLRRRSIILLISDLYEEPDEIIAALAHICADRGNEVIVFHLLDRTEPALSFADSSNFIDLETGERMPVILEYLRQQYKELMTLHSATLERRTRENEPDGLTRSLIRPKPLDQALFRYLLARQQYRRVR